MKVLWIVLFCAIAAACSSDDNKARVLVSEANALNELARAEFGKVPEESCIKTETAAKERIDKVYAQYPATPVANEIVTRMLKGSINSTLKECNRVRQLRSQLADKP